MNQLVRDVGEILRVIKDDDFSGEPGLMSKVRKHGARLDSLELTRTKAYTIAGVAGSVVGFVGAGVFKIFSLMEKHAP